MKEFEKPTFDIQRVNVTPTHGEFAIQHLESGFGTTVGNALRRVLLSSLPGLAVYAVEVEGAQHEYSQLTGVVEDLVQIILNVKKLVLKDELADDTADYTLKLDVHGEKEVKAGFIVCPDMVSVVNKDLTLCHLSENGHIKMTLHARRGRGLVLAEDNKDSSWPIGWIAVDSSYSPVLKVRHSILPDRIGHDASYERLVIEVDTDGSMPPHEAVALSAKILEEHFRVFEELEPRVKDALIMTSKAEASENKTTTTSLEDLDLSVRSYNCLKRNGLKTVQDLCNMKESELMTVRNLGKKSYKEILDKLASIGLSLQHDDSTKSK